MTAAALFLAGAVEAKVGKTKLAPDGLETSQMGLGGLHFAELDGMYRMIYVSLDVQ